MTEQDLDYVEQMYESGDDPWRISTGWYEERKRDLLLAALPQRRYRRGFEPACAAGELTARLAERVDALVAVDVSRRAVELTRDRVPSVEARRMQVPQDWPEGRFDLIVLSEFGYFLPPACWRRLAARVADSLDRDWTVVACHWKHAFPERLSGTDELHETLAAALPGRSVSRLDDEDFRLDVWGAPGRSLAARDDR